METIVYKNFTNSRHSSNLNLSLASFFHHIFPTASLRTLLIFTHSIVICNSVCKPLCNQANRKWQHCNHRCANSDSGWLTTTHAPLFCQVYRLSLFLSQILQPFLSSSIIFLVGLVISVQCCFLVTSDFLFAMFCVLCPSPHAPSSL